MKSSAMPSILLTGQPYAARVLVPVPVQHQIAQEAPLVAYAPGRLAVGWHYDRWYATASAVAIVFRNKAGREIAFVAAPFKGNCRAGMEKSFQLAGVKVYWAQGADSQQAWRCSSPRRHSRPTA